MQREDLRLKMVTAFKKRMSLQVASRLPALSHGTRVTAAELAALLTCGAVAAIAIGILHVPIRLPGHAILRGVLPMALGFALVPRRSAGTVMSVGAGLAAAAMSWGHVGRFPPAAMLSVLLLGPVLDVALAGQPRGWQLYARFIAAGALTNMLAFLARMGFTFFGLELTGARQFTEFWQTALPLFVLFGALAGLVSAALWFRLSPSEYRSNGLRRP
jgi:hypothetical protein